MAFVSHLLLKKEGAGRVRWLPWLIAAFLFSIFSADDAVGIHERIGSITSLDLMRDLRYHSYPWHIVVAPFLGFTLILTVLGIWKSVRTIDGMIGMILMALGCYAIAFGLDYYEGTIQMSDVNPLIPVPDEDKLPALMLTEEILEVSGTTLFLYVFLSHVTHLLAGTRLIFEPKESEKPD